MQRRLPALTALAASLAAAALGLLAAPARSADTPILPGYWESTNRLTAIITLKEVKRRCITAADVSKFMNGPSNRHYSCTYPTKVVEDGALTFKGSCVSKKGRQVKIEATGSYTPTSFTVVADVDTKLAGVPLGGRASTEARRISDTCPPPAPPEKS
jgi:hypothetical protein